MSSSTDAARSRRLWHAFWRGLIDGMSLGPLRRWWRARRGGAR